MFSVARCDESLLFMFTHSLPYVQNFNRRDFAICPFNARHVVPKREFDDHISRCEDRVSTFILHFFLEKKILKFIISLLGQSGG